MGVFGWCKYWRRQFESNISVKSFSLSNFSCTKCLQTMWGVDYGLVQQNKIVMCFTRGAIVPNWWHKKRHRARGALICTFLRVRQIGLICQTSKKSQIVSVKCDVSFDFLFKEWCHKLICNFLLRPRLGCSYVLIYVTMLHNAKRR
jgi:hypothetical protein